MTTLIPEYSAFAAAYEAGLNQVVYARLAADLDTPVSLMLKLTAAETDSFVLESVTGGEVRGRYSMVGMRPDVVWECHGERARINRAARYDPEAFEPVDGHPLDSLRALITESRIELPAGLPAASAGLFGFLGYDMIRLVEHLPNVNPDPLGLPDARMARPSIVAVLDGVKGDVIIVSPAWVGSGLSAKAAYAQAAERVMDAVRALERPVPAARRELETGVSPGVPQSNFEKADYLSAVEKAKEYIKAGDIFQVVPAQRWEQDFQAEPFAFYRALRRTNPSPFMFFFNFGGFQVAGASPEILVRLMDGEVTIRPIAGTRPRGATPEEDKALEEDLLADPKEHE
ncbi:MAG: chorismate-binding protein, partial [Pseudomonadota bacterium]